MLDKETEQELLAKAHKSGGEAMKLHLFYRGKIQILPKCIVRDFNDFALVSPGGS